MEVSHTTTYEVLQDVSLAIGGCGVPGKKMSVGGGGSARKRTWACT